MPHHISAGSWKLPMAAGKGSSLHLRSSLHFSVGSQRLGPTWATVTGPSEAVGRTVDGMAQGVCLLAVRETWGTALVWGWGSPGQGARGGWQQSGVLPLLVLLSATLQKETQPSHNELLFFFCHSDGNCSSFQQVYWPKAKERHVAPICNLSWSYKQLEGPHSCG